MRIHFIGIGGIGMSALARAYKKEGHSVSGYDLQKTSLTEQLKKEGIEVSYEPMVENVKNADVVVYTPAIPTDFIELTTAKELQKPLYKRSEMLAKFVNDKYLIAVAGTHGKTSISAVTTYLLNAKLKISAFVGGIMKNFNSNFVSVPNSRYAVAEADEYDKSFLKLKPKISVISSIDPDHSDIYPTFNDMIDAFSQFISQTGELVIINSKYRKFVEEALKDKKVITYGSSGKSGYEVKLSSFKRFSLYNNGKSVGEFPIYFHSKIVAENTAAAVIVALNLGFKPEEIQEILRDYKGVRRRFEIYKETEDFVLIDDYAHHPTEIEALLQTIKNSYKNYKVISFFQPHLFSRTRDFEDEFASVLDKYSDVVYLLPIYPAREKPIAGVSSENICRKTGKKCRMIELSELIPEIRRLEKDEGKKVVVIIGAGSIGNEIEKYG